MQSKMVAQRLKGLLIQPLGNCSEDRPNVWFEDSGTDKKTGGQNAGDRVEDVKILGVTSKDTMRNNSSGCKEEVHGEHAEGWCDSGWTEYVRDRVRWRQMIR